MECRFYEGRFCEESCFLERQVVSQRDHQPGPRNISFTVSDWEGFIKTTIDAMVINGCPEVVIESARIKLLPDYIDSLVIEAKLLQDDIIKELDDDDSD